MVKEYGSEYDWQANAEFMRQQDTGFVQPDWQLFRSGRDALKAFARIAARKKVLIPALCCESMILPFEQNGYEAQLYRMNEDLSANEEDIWQKLSPGAVLLYMRYFGIPALSDSFLQRVRERDEDILIIEDRTHDIFAEREAGGFEPDAVMASLRKWTALPEGGMLKCSMGRCDALPDSRFGDIRRRAMAEKSRYLQTGEAALKPHYMHEMGEAAELLDESGVPAAMSEKEEQHLRHIDFKAIMQRRVDNALYLQELLRPLEAQGKLRFMCQKPEDSTLYFTIYAEDRNALHRSLIDHAIYAAIIWPLAPGAAETCPVTAHVNAHMLAIPCDHRCRREDMDFIAEVIKESL